MSADEDFGKAASGFWAAVKRALITVAIVGALISLLLAAWPRG